MMTKRKTFQLLVTHSIPSSVTPKGYDPGKETTWTFSDLKASDVSVAIRRIVKNGNSNGKKIIPPGLEVRKNGNSNGKKIIPPGLEVGKKNIFTFEITRKD